VDTVREQQWPLLSLENMKAQCLVAGELYQSVSWLKHSRIANELQPATH
jgi:hypothetical protein